MRTKLVWALACLSPMFVAGSAMALKSNKSYSVHFDGALVGKWQLRNLVQETSHTCRYTIKWESVNRTPIARTVLCKLDEYKAGDFFDCEANRATFFDTVIAKNGCACTGFDEAGQQTRITSLIAGESAKGELFGIVMTASIGDVESLTVKAY